MFPQRDKPSPLLEGTCHSSDTWWSSGAAFCEPLSGMSSFFLLKTASKKLIVMQVVSNGWFWNPKNQLNWTEIFGSFFSPSPNFFQRSFHVSSDMTHVWPLKWLLWPSVSLTFISFALSSYIHDPVSRQLTSCGDFCIFARWETMFFFISTGFHESPSNISEDIELWTLLPRQDIFGTDILGTYVNIKMKQKYCI